MGENQGRSPVEISIITIYYSSSSRVPVFPVVLFPALYWDLFNKPLVSTLQLSCTTIKSNAGRGVFLRLILAATNIPMDACSSDALAVAFVPFVFLCLLACLNRR